MVDKRRIARMKGSPRKSRRETKMMERNAAKFGEYVSRVDATRKVIENMPVSKKVAVHQKRKQGMVDAQKQIQGDQQIRNEG